MIDRWVVIDGAVGVAVVVCVLDGGYGDVWRFGWCWVVMVWCWMSCGVIVEQRVAEAGEDGDHAALAVVRQFDGRSSIKSCESVVWQRCVAAIDSVVQGRVAP